MRQANRNRTSGTSHMIVTCTGNPNTLHFSGPVLLLRDLLGIIQSAVIRTVAASWMAAVFRDICGKCLHEDPSRFELVTFKCFYSDRHRGEQKMEVRWNPQSRGLEPTLYPAQRSRDRDGCERQSPIRPMPTISITGRFVLCDPQRGKCRGDKCTFAHSIEERDAWNAQRGREIRKPVLIQVPNPVGGI